MPDQEKEKSQEREKITTPADHPEIVPGRLPVVSEDEASRQFFG